MDLQLPLDGPNPLSLGSGTGMGWWGSQSSEKLEARCGGGGKGGLGRIGKIESRPSGIQEGGRPVVMNREGCTIGEKKVVKEVRGGER